PLPPPRHQQPTGSVRIAVTQNPPPVGAEPVNAGLAFPSAAPLPRAEPASEIEELSLDDIELQPPEPVVLVVSPDQSFEERCRHAAELQGLRLECATLVSAGDAAAKFE